MCIPIYDRNDWSPVGLSFVVGNVLGCFVVLIFCDVSWSCDISYLAHFCDISLHDTVYVLSSDILCCFMSLGLFICMVFAFDSSHEGNNAVHFRRVEVTSTSRKLPWLTLLYYGVPYLVLPWSIMEFCTLTYLALSWSSLPFYNGVADLPSLFLWL